MFINAGRQNKELIVRLFRYNQQHLKLIQRIIYL
jgi:hypothetical protein